MPVIFGNIGQVENMRLPEKLQRFWFEGIEWFRFYLSDRFPFPCFYIRLI